MGKGKKKSYYGVRIGRDGHRVYRNWNECSKAVNGFPNAKYKKFRTLQDASDWAYQVEVIEEPPLPSSFAQPPSSTPETPKRPVTELFVPGLYYADPNPDDSFGRDEIDFIPLPSSSPIKYLPTQSKPGQSDVFSSDLSTSQVEEEDGSTRVKSETSKDPLLSGQQQDVLARVLRGENIFFTGSAGTGKSVLLRAIISALREPSKNRKLAVTASTGIAAVNIGGSTLHSFAGCGLGKESVERLVGKIRGQKTLRHVWHRWMSVETLIIDEISMIDGNFFDKLERVARALRNNASPFGGIQLVLSGDFCQLPPVPDQHDGAPVPIMFAFDSNAWDKCVGKPIVLNKVFRQKDLDFVHMLDRMRYGELDDLSLRRFQELKRPVIYDDGIEATELYPLRHQVEIANTRRLHLLPESSHTYFARDTPGTDIRGQPMHPQQAEQLLGRLVAVRELTLKVGAQVMLIKNLVQGILVNGSLGRVIAFVSASEARIQLIETSSQLSRKDVLQTAYDHARKPDVEHIKQSGGKTSEDVPMHDARVWPVVEFTNGRTVLCIPLEFDIESATGVMEARREQIPLILAWALSIHKSQGQTLERVKVDLGKVFEKGQAYVALSRATSMASLQVLNFDKSKVMAHPRVIEWYSQLFKKIDEEEEWAILKELEDEEALKAYFDDDF